MWPNAAVGRTAATAEVSQVTVQARCLQALDSVCAVKQADLGCTIGWTERINSAGVTAFGVGNETGREGSGKCRPAVVEGAGKDRREKWNEN